MSEYQYYEFRAVDRPLTREEQAQLRACSTRARITATSFTNEYHWGNFKGDEEAWMERYFDASLYFANWGTRELKFRIPAHLLHKDAVIPYCDGESVMIRKSGLSTILTFLGEDIDDEEWLDGRGLLSTMISIRSELSRGDLRSLYLGWLRSVQEGYLDEEDLEPPVPRGLGDPTGAQREFVNFFDIGEDLLGVAAQASPPLTEGEPSREQIDLWLARMPSAERDDILARLIAGHEPSLACELFLRATRLEKDDRAERRRTVGELRASANETKEIRERAEAERRANEEARRERGAAAARAKYLDGLSGHEATLWAKVEKLVARKAGARYDEAILLLNDLRELAERGGRVKFDSTLESFRANHARKPALIERMNRARL